MPGEAKASSAPAVSKTHDQLAYFLLILFIGIDLVVIGFWLVSDGTRRDCCVNIPVINWLQLLLCSPPKTCIRSARQIESRRDMTSKFRVFM
jgi:hypothetical protein